MITVNTVTVNLVASRSTAVEDARTIAGLDYSEITWIHTSHIEPVIRNMNDFHNATSDYTVTFGINASAQ
jgi:hypothetical protein